MDAKQTNQLQPQVQTAYEKLPTNLIFKMKKEEKHCRRIFTRECVCTHA